MIIAILGIALLLLGYFLGIHILWVLGIVAIIVGLILAVVGSGPFWRRLYRRHNLVALFTNHKRRKR